MRRRDKICSCAPLSAMACSPRVSVGGQGQAGGSEGNRAGTAIGLRPGAAAAQTPCVKVVRPQLSHNFYYWAMGHHTCARTFSTPAP